MSRFWMSCCFSSGVYLRVEAGTFMASQCEAGRRLRAPG